MLPELLQKTNLYQLLFLIDCQFSEAVKNQRCPFCNNILHQADYPRKPRGGVTNIPDDYQKRHSLCCSDPSCRKRTLPQSCRFMGRKIYFWPAILIVMALRQNRENSYSAGKLMRVFNISRNTLKRWFQFFKECFPLRPKWHRLRGLFSTDIGNHEIPGRLFHIYLDRFNGNALKTLIQCLIVLESEGGFTVKIDGLKFHAEDG